VPHLPLQIGDVVWGNGDEFPVVFAQFIEQTDIIAAAWDVVEIDFFAFECRHGDVREPSSACPRVGESTSAEDGTPYADRFTRPLMG